MLKKYCVLVMILLTVATTNVKMAFAVEKSGKQDSAAEKIKSSVAKIGIGEKAGVTVTLRDNTKLTGYISQMRDTDFTIIEKKTKTAVVTLYTDVAKIKENKLSTAAKIGIGFGIGVAAYVVVIAVITKGFTRKISD